MKHTITLLIALLFAGTVSCEPAAAVGPKPTAVIVNQAADAIVNYLKLEEPLGKGATREMALTALRQTVDQYQGTGVSHVFWNVIYFFNNFQPVDSPVLLRTPEGEEVVDCQVADLLRAASDLPGAMANARVHAVSIYETLPPNSTFQQVLPAEITPPKSLTLKIHTGPKPATGRYVIRVGLDKSDDLKSTQLALCLNGSACCALEDLPAPAKPEPRNGLQRMNVCEVAPRPVQFEAPLDAFVRGYNAVELTVDHGGPQTVIWLEILIDPAPTTR